MKRLVLRAIVPVCCLALAQCSLPDTQPVGQFQVVGQMMTNTCGAQTGLFDARFQFPVELTIGRGTLQWKPVGVDASGATGTWRLGAFRLENESETTLAAPDRRTGYAGCVLVRHDVIEALTNASDTPQPDAGANATEPTQFTRFTGTETIVLGGSATSDCAGLVGASSGQVNALPCTVTYQLIGTRPTDGGTEDGGADASVDASANGG